MGDELVLNFAAPSKPVESGLSLTPLEMKRIGQRDSSGNLLGNWKQKRLAMKREKLFIKKAKTKVEGSSNPSIDEKNEKMKSATNSTDKKHSKIAKKEGAKEAKANKSAQKDKPTAITQKVTSLFSSNAAIPTITPKQPVAPTVSTPLFSTDSFSGLGLDEFLCSHLTRNKITRPTAIQRLAIPPLLAPLPRDIVIQSQTGSGKTLTYCLPILHRLMQVENARNVIAGKNGNELDRSVGTLAMVLAPTRELAKQIYDVLVMLLQFTNRTGTDKGDDSKDDEDDEESEEDEKQEPNGNKSRRHWLVPGIVIGGEKKKSEKARLRKGINILVSTPGRLLDHLKTTQSFKVENCRWIVFDEADRLMEMGFADTLREILDILRDRRATQERLKVECWPSKLQTVLCSATVKDDVKELAHHSLVNPEFIGVTSKASEKIEKEELKNDKKQSKEKNSSSEASVVTVPSQLRQRYVIIPTKLRLVALFAYLRSILLEKTPSPQPCKVIVFISCCDSVDFHYQLFANAHKAPTRQDDPITKPSKPSLPVNSANTTPVENNSRNTSLTPAGPENAAQPELLPTCTLFRLHGNLPQKVRVQATEQFRNCSRAILLCTDVAARGIDLPDVSHIVQLDPPVDTNDYVHRIGRTARIGKGGESMLVLDTQEVEYVNVLRGLGMKMDEEKMERVIKELGVRPINIGDSDAKNMKRKRNDEEAAMDCQMLFERFVVMDEKNLELAKASLRAHIRAYATHIASERHIFHVKKIHLGHLAKSMALREAPTGIGGPQALQAIKDEKNKLKKEYEKKRKEPLSATISEFGDGVLGAGNVTKKRKMFV